jgi:hypothetical protein
VSRLQREEWDKLHAHAGDELKQNTCSVDAGGQGSTGAHIYSHNLSLFDWRLALTGTSRMCPWTMRARGRTCHESAWGSSFGPRAAACHVPGGCGVSKSLDKSKLLYIQINRRAGTVLIVPSNRDTVTRRLPLVRIVTSKGCNAGKVRAVCLTFVKSSHGAVMS